MSFRLWFFLGYCLCFGQMSAAENKFIASEKTVQGYWQVFSPDNEVTGVIYLFMKDDKLFAKGIRVNVENQQQDISWVCQQGDKRLKDKAVWAGMLFENMERDHKDFNFFYGGNMQSAFSCVITKSELIFLSAERGTLHIPKALNYYNFDTDFTLGINYSIEKISKEKAMQGCMYKVSENDSKKWGDLVNSEKARSKMLKEMKLTKTQWLNLANQDKICVEF